MCGITGFINFSSLPDTPANIVSYMSAHIRHRGPDDHGIWFDEDARVALGHRRLSILDLSSAGDQPMSSPSGRYIIVYNGEIYNHNELRKKLQTEGAAPVWRGHSDTEVLLAALDHWGLQKTLEHLNGMFAFAVWDRKLRQLILGRDRVGEKPLYYGSHSKYGIFFGSELKALQAYPGFSGEINRDILTLYLRYKYIPAPHSIWKNIWKLPAAHYLIIPGGVHSVPQPVNYWDLHAIAQIGASAPVREAPSLVNDLDELLQAAVASRMEADVPLGTFLSGGIDSSLVASLMQARSQNPIRTFSIGFHEQAFNEADHAKAIAKHLGTNHTELYVTSTDALNAIPSLPKIWDEPFSDTSQIPTFLLSKMTREHVTVSLSGDGGDELFGGYERYFQAARMKHKLDRLPPILRKALATILEARPVVSGAACMNAMLPKNYQVHRIREKLNKLKILLHSDTSEVFYKQFISHWKTPTDVVLEASEPTFLPNFIGENFDDFRQMMMCFDTLTYLSDDILTKVDRASMAVSLEARVPLLDHRVIEFAWKLPMSYKIHNGTGKYILRQVLDRYVPRTLIDRPKMGFGVPIDQWLKGPLHDWATELLDETRLRNDGFFDPLRITQIWKSYNRGISGWHYYLWDILMFQAWWDYNRQAVPALLSDDKAKLVEVE